MIIEYLVEAYHYDSFTQEYQKVLIECLNQKALDKIIKSNIYIIIEVKKI